MNSIEAKQLIRQELPQLLQTDAVFRGNIHVALGDDFADKQQTEGRIEMMLAEIRAMREESNRRWDQQQNEIKALREESNQRWNEHKADFKANQDEIKALREESNRRWNEHKADFKANQDEIKALREESNRRWNEQQNEIKALREESNQRWDQQQDEIRAMREESNQRWNEQQEENRKLWQEVKASNRKYESTIGALGARWGIQSERSFRDALASILEESFGVQVLNVTERDDEGEVFGRPDQIELDIIIKNGLLIICEIKSSMSKSDMYTFGRKVDFYEKRHQRQANRRIVVSPMVDQHARPVAERLDIELFGYAEDVPSD